MVVFIYSLISVSEHEITAKVKSVVHDRFYYRPRSEASKGYVFIGVCHSVTERGGGGVDQDQDQVTTHPSLPPGPGDNTPSPWDQVTTPPSPGTRSQHLSPPQGTRSQHPLSLGPGDNTPPRTRWQHPPTPRTRWQHPLPPGPGHNTSLPPGTRWQHPPPRTRSQHLSPSPGTRGQHPLLETKWQHLPLPFPWDQVTTPPPPPTPGTRSQHPPWDQVTTPPPGTMRRRAVRILPECILVTQGFTHIERNVKAKKYETTCERDQRNISNIKIIFSLLVSFGVNGN